LTDYEKLAITKADFLPMERAFVYILYGCGLRRGEALALTRFDISLERRELSVTKAIAFDVNTPVLKDTKNYKHRTVPIPDSVYPAIADYIKSMHTTSLFHMKDGSYITNSSLDKMWARIVRKMQAVSEHTIEGLTPHIFRHNYCTSLCYQIPSVSIDKIAGLLGDTPKMVIEVYNHEIVEKEKPAETVSAALAL
jgi:integrase